MVSLILRMKISVGKKLMMTHGGKPKSWKKILKIAILFATLIAFPVLSFRRLQMTATLERWLSLEAFILLCLPLRPRTDNPLHSSRTPFSTRQRSATQTRLHRTAGSTRTTASCWMPHA